MDKRIIQSTKWSGLTELLSKLLAPLVNIALARLLTPEVFGVVATLTLVTSFADVFTDAGFQKYLVQHEFRDERDREESTNVAFWTNFGFSCLIWVVIFLLRDGIAELVGSRGYGVEVAVMSLHIPMTSLSSIQTALYRRDFRFKQLLPIRLITCLVPLFVTLPLAILLRNCWAIIIGTLAKEIVFMSALTIRSDWKPRLFYSVSRLKEMLSFSLTLLADSFMIWFTSHAGIFIVGRFLDPYHVGIFKTGISTITVYVNLFYTITAPVFFAGLSRAQAKKDECDHIYHSFQRYCALLIIPFGFGVFLYRNFVTQVLLGGQWADAALLLGGTALGLSYTIVTAQFNSDYFRALGKPKVALFVQTTYAIVMSVVLLWAVKQPFVMLCITQTCLRFVYSAISTAVLCVVFRINCLKIVGNLLCPTIASGIMAVAAILLQSVSSGIGWTIVSILLCMLVYFAGLLLLPPSRKELFSLPLVKRLRENAKENA